MFAVTLTERNARREKALECCSVEGRSEVRTFCVVGSVSEIGVIFAYAA